MDTTLLIFIVFSLITMIILYFVFFNEKEDYLSYTEDTLYDVVWKWEWKKDEVINLKCFCTRCDNTLVYENDYNLNKTYLICPSCEHQLSEVRGGDYSYVNSLIKRFIAKKVRLKEYNIS